MSSQTKTFEQWQQQANALQIEGRAYIDGQYQDSADGATFADNSPIDLTGIRLAELTRQAGIPDGVFNVVTGGAQVGQALALHPGIRAMAFTGSTKVAKQLLIYAGQSNMKRTYLEGGGKNAHIIFADTPDLARAARFAALGFCANQGAVCASGTRLLVESSIKEQFLAHLLEEVKRWQPGHPLDPATMMGPLIDARHQATVLGFVESARDEGASILCGGIPDKDIVPGGHFFIPTIIDNATPTMTASQNEIFGPVASIITFENEEEAIRLANDSEYGLTAGFWTPDIARVHRIARQLEAGTVWVNHFLTRDILSPFGGFKQSGIGRDLSIHALRQYGEMKATWVALKDIDAH